MPTLKFTNPASHVELAKHPTVDRDLRRAFKHLAGGRPPERIWRVANALMSQEARQLSFATGRPYTRCMFEILERKPHLGLGVGSYVSDNAYRGDIQFIDEEVRDET